MEVEEENFIKIKFALHIYTNGTRITESEVKILFSRVGFILTTDNTRYAELLGRYEMRSEANIVRFVDPGTEADMCTVNFANRLSDNERVFIVGTAELAENQISALIEGICCNLPEHVISWSFRPECGSFFEVPPQPIMKIDVVSFRFGNIINGNCFAFHLNDFETKSGERFGLMSNMDLKISHIKKELALRFKMTYCVGTNLELKHVQCKLIFDFCSIKEIITSVEYMSEYYLRYDYPPKFLVKDGNIWNRWTDCDLISKEIIGKSKVVRLRVDLDEDEDASEYSDLTETLIPELYSMFERRNCNIICVQMRDYCIDFTYDISDRNLPFEVKYILKCVDSISYAFADDLIINNRRISFNNLLDSLIANNRSALAVEALSRLFNSYFYNQRDVFNAYESFAHLLQIVRIGEDLETIGNKRDCLKRMVLTPMRTLYLPPSSSETRFISGNIDMTRLIKVHLRDEDHSRACSSPYPYLSEEFGESDFYYQLKESRCRNYFLKNVIFARLFGENGIISKNSYKFHGTSLSELFTDGIMLEAESLT